jgi:hypothetical protein
MPSGSSRAGDGRFRYSVGVFRERSLSGIAQTSGRIVPRGFGITSRRDAESLWLSVQHGRLSLNFRLISATTIALDSFGLMPLPNMTRSLPPHTCPQRLQKGSPSIAVVCPRLSAIGLSQWQRDGGRSSSGQTGASPPSCTGKPRRLLTLHPRTAGVFPAFPNQAPHFAKILHTFLGCRNHCVC